MYARSRLLVAGAVLALGGNLALSTASSSSPRFDLDSQRNPTGVARTLSIHGEIDTDNPFFQSLGTNGRACVDCHEPAAGWSITPSQLQARFEVTGGEDPVFRANDGSNSPLGDMSTVEARRGACSMLLNKGLIRVGMPIPDGAEFSLETCADPYGFASSQELSLFRRPLPATNLRFLSAVMWDGREGKPDSATSLNALLANQALHATLGHAQASLTPTDRQLQQIVRFETGLYTAQVRDRDAGNLDAEGAEGGPVALALQPFQLGINDPLGGNPTGEPFDPAAFDLFQRWGKIKRQGTHGTEAARASVARGQALFNHRTFTAAGVSGLNDDFHRATVPVTCTTCHDSPNVGNHSLSVPLNIGVSDARLRTPDLPLYTLKNNATGETVQTTDPGRALVTGKWKDIGRFKGPVLRGLAARAPYFHNGSAATLADVVEFYDIRFGIGLKVQEKADLAAFLRSL